ncbi:conserved protein of unknown function [Candidatus Hydrogenisulfobacillus filiaventi]|uniref:Metal-binding protein n=1 Tax=Candidatus Hydrogenisulfobacillus filiaventi TaxID=2707344 RepID=A0A6F8ZEJ8_9FIRM|nr:DUF2103 domain-containing protein [Bacillota bacterium]CAB1128114.1 conserved protein of unknown function [Candidatus Hydrogenisulfobacillus filiaventi]
MAKYRQGKVKRQHHVLRELEAGLAFIGQLPEVDGVIPGTIKPKAGGSTGFSFQYLTSSGIKLIGRSGGAAQEVFIITAHPQAVLEALRREGLLPPA